MRLHRFYIKKVEKREEEILINSKELMHQWLKVFRFREESELIIFDESCEYKVRIKKIEDKEITLEIIEQIKKDFEDKPDIYLFISIPKKTNLELIFQKCTEIGIKNFIPIISDKTEKKDFNQERAEKIIIEAIEQSGQNKIPKIYKAQKLEKLDINSFNLEKNYVLDIDAEKIKLDEVKKYKKIGIFIGPEGGWSKKDLDFFEKNKVQKISLGKNILRTETATIVSSALFLIK